MSNTFRWLTTEEAAERACCSAKTIRRAVHGGRLQATRIRGRDFRFLEGWIDEWLLNQVVPEHGEIDIAIDVAPGRYRELSLIA